MVNIQHVILNHTTKLAKLCMSAGAKFGHAQKRDDLIDCNRLWLQHGNSQQLYLKGVYHMAEIQTYPLYPKIVLETKPK